MIYREDLEKRELETLSPFACKSIDSKGRAFLEEPCPYRTAFQRDRDRIVHSKAFRRLMHKTQVFLAPEGDHYRTRLTHTIEVSQVSRTIARILNLNEDLTEAIAMGHDLGHTPFGHNGEYILNELNPKGFRHNEQSLRVVDIIEKKPSGKRLNLTFEVRMGIKNHTGNLPVDTLEGQIVKISDRIAYINHDIDDAIRSGVISEADLPRDAVDAFGHSSPERIGRMVQLVTAYSDGKDFVLMDPENKKTMDHLRAFMFENVYKSTKVKREEDLKKVETVVSSLYKYFLDHKGRMPMEYQELLENWDGEIVVCDYIAGMTDRFALGLYTDLFVPKWGM